MSQFIDLTTARKTAYANLFAGWVAGGRIDIYDGTKPTSADSEPTTQVLLCSFTLPSPIGTVSNSGFTADAISPAMVSATGTHTAGWARVYDAADVAIGNYDVGLASDNTAAILLDSLTLIEGAYVSITSFTHAEG